ncbi:hypothetical protein [Streptomyces decoyicus]|uniref:hypothetical protein n=1 Tax=Streptomyces decoyicus TaxID=249567 RepID=UPI00386385ED|nr:hypothetical protein OG532_06755 [Streptomyces decoyicus]
MSLRGTGGAGGGERAVAVANTLANTRLNRIEQVKKIWLPGGKWGPESDELTPSWKLCRREIHLKYGQILDGLYTL